MGDGKELYPNINIPENIRRNSRRQRISNFWEDLGNGHLGKGEICIPRNVLIMKYFKQKNTDDKHVPSSEIKHLLPLLVLFASNIFKKKILKRHKAYQTQLKAFPNLAPLSFQINLLPF